MEREGESMIGASLAKRNGMSIHELIAHIRKRLVEGESASEIKQSLGMSKSAGYFTTICREYKIEIPLIGLGGVQKLARRIEKKYSKDILTLLHDPTIEHAQVARRMYITPQAVSQIRQRLGITLERNQKHV
jgi:predicted transcriptional regulator